MPLPVENIEWPPKDTVDALMVIAEWDLWYGGDPQQLTERGLDQDASQGGSKTWRFWNRRTPSTSSNARREQLHIPIAGDIAATSADLLFGSPLDITVPGIRSNADDPEGNSELQATQDRIDEISERGGLLNRLLEAAEEAAALGGVYLRPTWDADVADHPILTYVTPDRAVPVFRFGILTEVTFWRTLTDEGEKKVLRHLEHHSTRDGKALIENALYQGTEDKVGSKIDLEGHPFTADMDEEITLNVEGLATRYLKNMGPARRLRGTHHGRSDFDGIEPLFDAIDEAWNSWMRDLRLGKARIIVPDSYLERRAPGKGAFFDVDQEIFTPLEIEPGEHKEAMGIEKVEFKIRYEEHQGTVTALVLETIGKAGYSGQTFGFHEEGGSMTATEVRARTDKTHRTLAKKRRYAETPLEDILRIMLVIDREMLSNKETSVLRPDVDWPDLAAPDMEQLATTVELLARAEAASTEVLVRMQHPDWSDAEILAEVEKIMDSKPKPVPNPFDIGGEVVPEGEGPEEDEEPEE